MEIQGRNVGSTGKPKGMLSGCWILQRSIIKRSIIHSIKRTILHKMVVLKYFPKFDSPINLLRDPFLFYFILGHELTYLE